MTLAAIALTATAWSQSFATSDLDRSGFYGSVRGGYDVIPMFNNNTPYIDYKGGMMLGPSEINY